MIAYIHRKRFAINCKTEPRLNKLQRECRMPFKDELTPPGSSSRIQLAHLSAVPNPWSLPPSLTLWFPIRYLRCPSLAPISHQDCLCRYPPQSPIKILEAISPQVLLGRMRVHKLCWPANSKLMRDWLFRHSGRISLWQSLWKINWYLGFTMCGHLALFILNSSSGLCRTLVVDFYSILAGDKQAKTPSPRGEKLDFDYN